MRDFVLFALSNFFAVVSGLTLAHYLRGPRSRRRRAVARSLGKRLWWL